MRAEFSEAVSEHKEHRRSSSGSHTMLSSPSNRGTKSLCGVCFRANRWTKLLVLFMVVFVSLESRVRNSRHDLLLREGSTKTTKRLWRVRTGDLRVSSVSNTTNTTEIATEEEAKPSKKEQSNSNRGGDDFEQEVTRHAGVGAKEASHRGRFRGCALAANPVVFYWRFIYCI